MNWDEGQASAVAHRTEAAAMGEGRYGAEQKYDYRLFDDIIIAAQEALANSEGFADFLGQITDATGASSVSLFCYDDDDETILQGISLTHPAADMESIRDWQSDSELSELTRQRFDYPHRLTDMLPVKELINRDWYRAQFEDNGIDNAVVQDFGFGGRRCRLILLRHAPSLEFSPLCREFLFRLSRQFSRIYGRLPKSFYDRDEKISYERILLRKPSGSATFEPNVSNYLQSHFDLSPAEIRAAYSISDGRPLDQGAERLGISVNTLKSHLKRVYEKLDIHRAAELLHLIARIRENLTISQGSIRP